MTWAWLIMLYFDLTILFKQEPPYFEMMRRLARPVGIRAYAAPKKGGKKGAGAKGATEKLGGVGDFEMDDMYPDLKLSEMTEADVPAWAREIATSVLEPQPEEPPAPGQEDRKFFKQERRAKIKTDNERRGMGL